MDAIAQTNGTIYAKFFQIPHVMTEFGATNNLQNITEVLQQADLQHMGWLEWAYTGNDPTSTAPNAQALVYNPELPPSAEASSNCPTRSGRPDHHGSFVSGEQTIISVPPVEYPNGFPFSVKGGQVTSAPGAALLTVVADPGANTVEVVVAP